MLGWIIILPQIFCTHMIASIMPYWKISGYIEWYIDQLCQYLEKNYKKVHMSTQNVLSSNPKVGESNNSG